MLPTYMALNFGANMHGTPQQLAAFASSLQRSWESRLGSLRSSLWSAIYLASQASLAKAAAEAEAAAGVAAGAVAAAAAKATTAPAQEDLSSSLSPPLGQAEAAASLEDMRWNLRTWPLESVDWPVTNSHRMDIQYDPNPSRFGKTRCKSVGHIFPANERVQHRWNGDPRDVSDGGTGMMETDPGAWLLPYWMARYHRLIKAPASNE
jgi:hypothetical protein